MGLEVAALAVVGAGTFKAISQIQQGKAESKAIRQQTDYNSQIYLQQAEMIQQQKKLQAYQDDRSRARLRGSIIARSAGGGFKFGGSPAALLVDAESQMLMDKRIGQYNYDVQKSYAESQAESLKFSGYSQAYLAKRRGYTNAFSTALNTVGILGRL